jgi:fermentation-respiration switch protein FrsA (DUF1100 family)
MRRRVWTLDCVRFRRAARGRVDPDVLRKILTVLIWTVGAYAVIVGLFWAGQRRMIYLADATRPAPVAGVDEVALETDDGLALAAWWVAPAGETDTAVIVFPGNAGHRGDRLPLARALADQGLAVLLVDYRGYGGNLGSPSEDRLLLDARAAQQWVAERDPTRVVYFGESLGSGPATALALEQPPDALVLRSPYTSLGDVGRHHYPFLPVGLLLKDRYPVEKQIPGVAAPVVVIAGSRDSIVPFALSERVAEAADVELVVVEGADHNDPALGWGPEVIKAVVRAAG